MRSEVKGDRRARPGRRTYSLAPASVSSQGRRQAVAILEVLAGVRRPSEAAQVLETSLPRYYQLERRALTGLLAACEPAPRGPRIDASRRISSLERENRRLQRECDRQQALVRAAERSLGLVLPPIVKPPVKGQEGKPGSSGTKRRRSRRPSVRALKAVRVLQAEEVAMAVDGAAVAAVTISAMNGG
jgi:hypothetical protein